ncbi:type III secretion system inner rod subunit SctI [Escherichia coli]|uniref:type III secretion system inner rod subunit SctI n=1 Tax=Escherichia coli TaxID=562 RepID=UPI000BE306FB|nr:type III secretion system inner rod subunit SctI [Escherichia coli]HDV3255434.1 type III secretion system inner rod subunit SctI [Escherichia coli]
MSVSNMPPIDRAEQSTAHEIQQAKVIDLNDRVLNLDNPDDKMISAFANYAVQTENWQQNALQALTCDKKGLTPEKLLVLQDHVLNYNVEVSLVGTLARKIVAAVETLTRS